MQTNPQLELARRYVEQTGVSVFLTGKAGDELRLNFEDLTEMSEPDEGYTLGDWDPQLPFYWAEEDFTYGDPITEDTTYTYTYAPIEAESAGKMPLTPDAKT